MVWIQHSPGTGLDKTQAGLWFGYNTGPGTGLDKTQAGLWFGYNTGWEVVWIKHRPGSGGSDTTQARLSVSWESGYRCSYRGRKLALGCRHPRAGPWSLGQPVASDRRRQSTGTCHSHVPRMARQLSLSLSRVNLTRPSRQKSTLKSQ